MNTFLEKIVLLLLFFFVPIWPQISTILIIILVLLRIPKLNSTFFINLIKKKELLGFVVVYMILCLGMLYTVDHDSGLSKLQTQFSLFILPFILGGGVVSYADRLRYLNTLVIGVITAILICLFHSLMLLIENQSFYVLDEFSRNENIFFYNRFSEPLELHPTYFAMYIGVSIIYMISSFKEITSIGRITKIIILVILSVGILLTSSKGGIISLIVVSVLIILIGMYKKKFQLFKVLITSAIVIVTIFILFRDTTLHKRYLTFSDNLPALILSDENINESTSIRLNIWNLSYYTILDQPIIGYGTGSVKKILNENCLIFYSFSTCELMRNMNSHNEYLNSLVSNGVLLFITLIISLIYCIIAAYRNSDLLYFLIIIFMMMNFLFESILQRERGVVFFMLIIVLLSISESKKIVSHG